MNLNLDSPPSPFPIQRQIGADNIDMSFGSINFSSSSSLSCPFFLDSTHDSKTGYCQDDQPGLFQPQHNKDENQGIYNHVGSKYEMKNTRVHPSGFKLTLWKNDNLEERVNNHPVKWMSSKMRLMHKIKNNPSRVTLKMSKNKLENETSSFESDDSSGIGSYTNNNGSLRVCSDCNTTKTPLWRSGPKGPKSLCNACGIRQRKARRAMAAAAAAAASDHQNGAPTKIKAQHDKGKNVNFKKRRKTSTSEAGSQSDGRKKIGFEDFLINLSKNLSFHHVFPEDEKDAAILLMALSSGLVHG